MTCKSEKVADFPKATHPELETRYGPLNNVFSVIPCCQARFKLMVSAEVACNPNHSTLVAPPSLTMSRVRARKALREIA